ncbi:DUF4434 domain-containing protein [Vibrio splendidus]|uniref:DUF4434 domain-containing protein n=1 Tax=Vibrio splendidus TaxID=29497 RepID=UPI000CB8614A|nr:DUF4434 domain-containing protein [Vibrio splendidus]PMH69643.1 hypothetical protein BCU61_12105 [Vibrio splendidus]PMJ28414.1 hypothetical protein BCU26_04255 [Vibrio splendidus]
MFYQPLNRDVTVTNEQWLYFVEDIKKQGIDTVVVQWNRYGDEKFGGENGWLSSNLTQFADEGLTVWLGLYSDPEYFQRIHTTVEEQKQYLNEYVTVLLDSYRSWNHWITNHTSHVEGLYLPFEISDYDFDSPAKRAQLHTVLEDLSKRYDEPLMISVYLSGQLSPKGVAQWLNQLRALDIDIYVQDGRGTQLIEDTAWANYSKEISCDIGLIREAFVQTNQTPFEAKSIEPNRLSELLTEDSCHKKVLFSLRYLPSQLNPLKLKD